MQSTMPPFKLVRSTSFSMTTHSFPVRLDEVFDYVCNPTTADYGQREELSNMRICVNLPCEGKVIKDWRGLERELAEDGMEVFAKEGIFCVSGYPSRNGFDYERKIKATLAKYQRGSRSVP